MNTKLPCEICGIETPILLYNDSFEKWEAICADFMCEKQLYNETEIKVIRP